MPHTASFDILTPHDFFHNVVIPQYDDFVANNASSRYALLTTIVAYHMYEWINPSKFEINDFKLKYPADASLADDFEVARRITNGTKHFKSTVKTRKQSGFSSGFSDGFARPLMIELLNGSEKSADRFLREIVNFWRAREKAGDF